jgi:tetratricopeptide (TPR) repeat protein
VLGHGAGSYEYLWYEDRVTPSVIRDAHSLYAETFAELGVVGIVLLGLALLVPLIAAVRARRNRLVPAAAAAYVAWVAHAAMDWHWEVVGVTAVALLAGGVALLAAERGAVRPLRGAARGPLLAGSVALTVCALVSLVGNQALFAGREALLREEWREADDHGRRAEILLPWSFEPRLVRGDAAARRGDRARAAEEYREAVEVDPRSWIAWLRLAQVARGAERLAAYRRVHELNPLERDLPGEPEGVSP